jgi:alcohol dehydrogenase
VNPEHHADHGLENTNTTRMLLKTVESRKLQPENLTTHRFAFDQPLRADDVFASATRQKALKVIISSD